LDEAASLGHMEALDDAVDKYVDTGVMASVLFSVHFTNSGSVFPDGQDQTLLSNVSQVFLGPMTYRVADYVSNRLGEETIVVRSGGNEYRDLAAKLKQRRWQLQLLVECE